ncbi:odorant receptor 82a-like [Leptopilina boulardi]|uniref:odorant receptor 82a-like n=1 Tax=Leptopilina boulardi TaxID=63433 RepID=UPI0021F61F67|nr:odorant receptor 82a-like [Leptopilina boulardi]
MSSKSNEDSIKFYNSDYIIDSCRPIAIVVGLWPINYQISKKKKIITIILNFIAITLMSLRLISNILYGIFELKTLAQKAQIAGPACFQIANISKYLLILIKGEKIEKCFQIVKEDWCRIENNEQREVMMKHAKFGRYIIIICTIFIFFGGLGYNLITPLTSNSIITHMNISVKPFPSPIYGKFFTSGLSPIYEIVFYSHILVAFFLYSVTPVAFSFVAMLTLHACGQFEIVILYLKKILNNIDDDKNSIHEKFVIVVNSHLRVIIFVAKLEAVFTEICLIEIMGCSIDLCLLGYYIIMCAKQSNYSQLITFSFLFSSFLFNIFIYCYIGEMLTHQAKKVGESCFLINWYLLPKKTLKDLIFFIRCAQSSTKITAGKIITLSFSTFGSVIKTAGAYCNALWKMTK